MEGAYFLTWLEPNPRRQVEGPCNCAHRRTVSFKTFLSFLTALALLAAPAFAPAAAASVGPADHHEQMMKTGHCESMPEGDENKAADKSCCVKMCMAVAADLTSPLAERALPHCTDTPTLDSFLVGTTAEIATPPPRAA